MSNPMFSPPRIDRRGLLAAVGPLVLGLASCSGGAPATDPGQAGSPRPGGLLRVAFAGTGAQESLDPHRANLFLEGSRSKMIFEKLAEFGDDMAAVPRLAESWEPSKDLTEWTIRLRRATFHDGRPVGPADVLYSYRRIVDPKLGFRARTNLAMVDLSRCRAIDERTVRLVLDRPYAEFPNSLAAFGAFIVPEGADRFDRPVGSGPFSFDTWTPGVSLRLNAYDDYWEGRPHVDQLEYLITNEESARINALIGGQVHYAHDLTPATAKSFANRSEITFTRLPNSGMNGLALKVDRPPFNHPDARRALFALADRQELINAALGGLGAIGNDLYGRGYQYYADDIPQREPDLDLARSLIAKSGLADAEIVIETADDGSGLVASASVFTDQLRRAGLRASVRHRDPGTYWSEILTQGTIGTYRSGSMPIESHIAQRLLTTSSTNATRWQDPHFDALYTEAISTPDVGKRAELYHELQLILHDRGGFLIWGFADWILASAANLAGVPTAPTNSLNWGRFDRVWFE